MTLQNRVDPWSVLHAVLERGTLMGNRGGRIHRDDKTLTPRRWASRRWICCELHYKDWHHEPMGQGYTTLFFLDEVTALASGHRPCMLCRRIEARAFLGGMSADAMDRVLHAERLSPRTVAALPDDLPDGAMIDRDGTAFAIRGDRLLRWSFAGYVDSVPRKPSLHGSLLTPPAITAILRGGYKPRWHQSAGV